MSYERDEAMRHQEATEAMIRMREPRRSGPHPDPLDDMREELKAAFVAGCCAALTWTNSGMPQDDLDEAGYDYAASVLK